jgi:serine/threonine protein phosphatase 1
MKTFAIGDIHGNLKALKQVLQRSAFDKEVDRLFVLGDVCDGWPDVAECVETLLNIPGMIPIMGNHDEWTRDWLKFGIAPLIWVGQGGEATMNSYKECPGAMVTHLIEYFDKAHYYYVDENNNAYVHGGWASKEGLGNDRSFHYIWDRAMWTALGVSHHYGHSANRTKKYNKVFIGHTALGQTKPEKRCNCWNLDTGAGYAGKLTMMNVETEEYWQSDSNKALYSDQEFLRQFNSIPKW